MLDGTIPIDGFRYGRAARRAVQVDKLCNVQMTVPLDPPIKVGGLVEQRVARVSWARERGSSRALLAVVFFNPFARWSLPALVFACESMTALIDVFCATTACESGPDLLDAVRTRRFDRVPHHALFRSLWERCLNEERLRSAPEVDAPKFMHRFSDQVAFVVGRAW